MQIHFFCRITKKFSKKHQFQYFFSKFAIGIGKAIPVLLTIQKRYAYLVSENLRNFQRNTRWCDGSRISAWAACYFFVTRFSQDPHLTMWYISATLLFINNSIVAAGWDKNYSYESEKITCFDAYSIEYRIRFM